MELVPGEGVNLEELRLSLPELPKAKRERFRKEFGLPEKQIEVLAGDRYSADYFEKAVSEFLALESGAKKRGTGLVANYLTSDLGGLLNEQGIGIQDAKVTPENFAELVKLIQKGDISSRIAKDVLREMAATGMDPNEIIQEKELIQISDKAEINKIVEKVIIENQDAVESYKKGKTNSLQFLAGQVMKEAKGRTNPQVVQELLKKLLENEK
jgi:aspartyl-tRNA(Asn)/glutamyl-tRNA(Gln) amidotransferase subunit B